MQPLDNSPNQDTPLPSPPSPSSLPERTALEQIARFYGNILNVYAEPDQVAKLMTYYGPSGIDTLSFEFLTNVANNSVRASLVLSGLQGILAKWTAADWCLFVQSLSKESRLPLQVFSYRASKNYPGLAGG